MSNDYPKSETRKDSFVEERFLGLDHYVNEITDSDGTKTEGRGNTPEKAQERASEKHENKKKS